MINIIEELSKKRSFESIFGPYVLKERLSRAAYSVLNILFAIGGSIFSLYLLDKIGFHTNDQLLALFFAFFNLILATFPRWFYEWDILDYLLGSFVALLFFLILLIIPMGGPGLLVVNFFIFPLGLSWFLGFGFGSILLLISKRKSP